MVSIFAPPKDLVELHSLATLLDQLRNQTRPSRLMTRPDSSAIVTVEVFVEVNEIAPVRIVLEFFEAAVHRARAFCATKENARQAPRDFRGGVPK
jgi:hypothetical protein